MLFVVFLTHVTHTAHWLLGTFNTIRSPALSGRVWSSYTTPVPLCSRHRHTFKTLDLCMHTHISTHTYRMHTHSDKYTLFLRLALN